MIRRALLGASLLATSCNLAIPLGPPITSDGSRVDVLDGSGSGEPGGRDLGGPDVAAADLSRPDAVPDRGLPDAASADQGAGDATAVAACAAIAHPVMAYGPSMVICRHNDNTIDNLCSAANPCVTPCTAASLCAPGWTLCAPATFQARGGTTTPTTKRAWLGGCVRDGSNVTSPLPTVCSQCTTVSAALATSFWGCNGGTPSGAGTHAYMGLVSNDTCFRVGEDLPQNAAYWDDYPAGWGLAMAICCQ